MAALGLIGGLLSIAAYRSAPAVIVAPMQYSQIIWATVLGFLVFGERPGVMTGVGICLIIGAGLVVLVRQGEASSKSAI